MWCVLLGCTEHPKPGRLLNLLYDFLRVCAGMCDLCVYLLCCLLLIHAQAGCDFTVDIYLSTIHARSRIMLAVR